MVAHRPDKSLSSSLLDSGTPGTSATKLLPVAAIYGANAAGKTNTLYALSYMIHAIRSSQSQWEPNGHTYVQPFLGIDSKSPSSFEVELYLDGQLYRYGFAANRHVILEEWMYSHPLGRERLLFKRSSSEGSSIRTTKNFGSDTGSIESTKRRVRSNSLFLSAAAQDNHPAAALIYKYFQVAWYNVISDMDSKYSTFTSTICSNPGGHKDIVLSFLKIADPSITDFVIEPIQGKGWNDYPSGKVPEDFFDDDQRYNVSFRIGEGSGSFLLPFDQQSKGVKKIYCLVGTVLVSLSQGHLIMLDELETSIHPHLARMIVDLFQDSRVNTGKSQLLFTTHDTSLLDQTLLRRDQIWFVEKEEGSSRLYSLLEFSPRKDADLETGYLRGRYGAIPVARMPTQWLTAEGTLPIILGAPGS